MDLDKNDIEERTEWLKWATADLKGGLKTPYVMARPIGIEVEDLFGKRKGREMKIENKDNPLNWEV